MRERIICRQNNDLFDYLFNLLRHALNRVNVTSPL